jgi:hypothetical protein
MPIANNTVTIIKLFITKIENNCEYMFKTFACQIKFRESAVVAHRRVMPFLKQELNISCILVVGLKTSLIEDFVNIFGGSSLFLCRFQRLNP